MKKEDTLRTLIRQMIQSELSETKLNENKESYKYGKYNLSGNQWKTTVEIYPNEKSVMKINGKVVVEFSLNYKNVSSLRVLDDNLLAQALIDIVINKGK